MWCTLYVSFWPIYVLASLWLCLSHNSGPEWQMGIGAKSWQSYRKSIKSHCCAICRSGRILAHRTVPALTTTRPQRCDAVLPTVLGHLLHSFIYNLITDGVGIASLWWMKGQLDSGTDGVIASLGCLSCTGHWGHTVHRKSLCPTCLPACLSVSLVWRVALWAARDAVSSTLFSLIFLWPLWRLPNRWS